jgi:quinolinate synthase
LKNDDRLAQDILELKRERNAVILAHNYQVDEVQDIADFVGDSLGLSRQAAQTDAGVIVFCGVHFMAETAAMLSPQKTVLLPDIHAGCPMADMVTVDKLRELKAKHPGVPVVTYINSSAEVKAESDYCCTSANAIEVVSAVPSETIIFTPDQHLGSFVEHHTSKNVILWSGFCPTHRKITADDIIKQKSVHADAKVVAHPECRDEVVALADHVASTTGILQYCHESSATAFIIGTENGVLYKLRRDNPGKQFYPASERAVCPNMKKITLEKVLWALEDMNDVVTVPDEIARQARHAIDRMLAIT